MERSRTTPARSHDERIVSSNHTKQVPHDDGTTSKEGVTACRLSHIEPTLDFLSVEPPAHDPFPSSDHFEPRLDTDGDPSYGKDYGGESACSHSNDGDVRAFEGV